MMGMGGTGGRDSARRRRMVAMFIVFAMVLGAGATLLAIVLACSPPGYPEGAARWSSSITSASFVGRKSS